MNQWSGWVFETQASERQKERNGNERRFMLLTYKRIGSVHTCLYVRALSSGDWDLFRARGKRRGFRATAAARNSQHARVHTIFPPKHSFLRKPDFSPLGVGWSREKWKKDKGGKIPYILWRTASGARRLAASGGALGFRETLNPKAPPLAARPVPWNGRGRRLMELIDGCYSEGDSRVNKVTPRVLGIPTISFQ